MIRKAAVYLSKLWAESGVIPAGEEDAYQYGIELLFSTALNVIVMIFLSVVTGNTWLFIPYLIAFIPLRIFAGGYHAKHHYSCILFNAFVYFASLIAVNSLSTQTAVLACIIESCVSLALIFFLAPVPAKNKPLSTAEQKRNRYIALSLGFLFLILCMLFYYKQILELSWCRILFCGQASATILMIAEKLRQTK
jgi:accessory gene regulator B